MKVKYDQEVDVLTIQLSSAPVEESDEDKPGVILDYDKDGRPSSDAVLSPDLDENYFGPDFVLLPQLIQQRIQTAVGEPLR